MSNLKNELHLCTDLNLVHSEDSRATFTFKYGGTVVPVVLRAYSGVSLSVDRKFAIDNNVTLKFIPGRLDAVNSEIYPCTMYIEFDDLYISPDLFLNGGIKQDNFYKLVYTAIPVGEQCIVVSTDLDTREQKFFVYDLKQAKQEFNLVAKENSTTSLF